MIMFDVGLGGQHVGGGVICTTLTPKSESKTYKL